MMLSPMPHCDLGLIHFLLKCRDNATHCTEFSSHTSAKSPSLSGRPNHHHLSSASGVCQVSLEACHLSIYSGGDKAQLRACRMNLTWYQQIQVSPTQLSAGKCLPCAWAPTASPTTSGRCPTHKVNVFLTKLHVAKKSMDTYTTVALSANLMC